MPGLKYNAINLIRRGGDALQAAGDGGSAYALHEVANNLLLVMEGKETLQAFLSCYTADGCQQLDLDDHLPPPDDDDSDAGEDDDDDFWEDDGYDPTPCSDLPA